MKIPNGVKIGFKDYEVSIVDNEIYVDGKECYGQIDYDDYKIKIGSKFKDSQKEATFIHEVLHGIDEMYGVGLKEKQVEVLANGIYIFLKDNYFKEN